MQFWGDIILQYPEMIKELPKDVIVLNWGYEADHPFNRECRAFAEASRDFYVCPGTSAWNSIGGRWENARENLWNAAQNGYAHGAKGYLITDWGDNGHLQQYPVSLPAYLYGAGVSWAEGRNRDLNIEECLSQIVFKDSTGEAASALMLLSNSYLSTGITLKNASILGILLLVNLHTYYMDQLSHLKKSGLMRAEQIIKKSLLMLKTSSMTCNDAELLQDEIAFTGKLMLHACNLGYNLSTAHECRLEAIPEAKKRRLTGELNELIEEYETFWPRRSRPGGLSDSLGRLEKLKVSISRD